jgi:hypothetical protein
VLCGWICIAAMDTAAESASNDSCIGILQLLCVCRGSRCCTHSECPLPADK